MRIEWLHEQTKAFIDAAQGLDFDAKVPTCPEWSVRLLVGHIGQEHRWAAQIARTGAPPGIPDVHDVDVPEDWAKWLLEGAEELAEAVRGNDRPVWVILGTGPASFWLRRMVHETAVHRVDAAITAGVGYELPEDLAAGAIQEALELLTAPGVEEFKPAVAQLRGNGETLQIRPDGYPGWLITRTPDGVVWHEGTGDADVAMSGTAQDLLLVCYGRLPLENVTITGNRELFVHWLAHTRI